MQHLALGNRGRGVRQDLQHAHDAGIGHQLEGAGQQVIAHEHAGLVVPQQVCRGPPAPLLAFIDHVVMQQRRGMDELHRCGQMDVIGPAIAAELRRRQRQHRPQPLAAGLDQMRGDLGDARRVARGHAFADQIVDRRHFRRKLARQAVHRGIGNGSVHGKILSVTALATRWTAVQLPASVWRMKELLRTTDPLRLIRAQDVLRADGIETYALDQHMSILEGSLGILPRRLMVADRDHFMAQSILREHGLND